MEIEQESTALFVVDSCLLRIGGGMFCKMALLIVDEMILDRKTH